MVSILFLLLSVFCFVLLPLPHISQIQCWRNQKSRNTKRCKKKSLIKACFLQPKDHEKAVQKDRKLLDNNWSTPAKHHRKTRSTPASASKGQVGAKTSSLGHPYSPAKKLKQNKRLTPSWGCNQVPQPPCQVNVRKGSFRGVLENVSPNYFSGR